jgi:hypothetical protein
MVDAKPSIAMAYRRSRWIEIVGRSLAGIVGEYAKLKMADLSGYGHDWEPEIKRLVRKLETFMAHGWWSLRGSSRRTT